MLCKFCQTENIDDATYCKHCGKRVDGNKVCPTCRKLVADDAIYCNYCGSRVDGKKVCPTCHEAHEGRYCPKCGTSTAKTAVAHTREDVGEITVEGARGWKNIVGKVGHSLLLFGVVIALIFVFLIGYGVSVKTNVDEYEDMNIEYIAQQYGLTSNVNIFRYFGEIYEDIDTALSNSSYKVEDFTTPAMYIAAVAGTLIAAGTLISVIIISIVAITKLVRKLMGNEVENAEKLAIAAFLVYVLGAALMYALNCGSVHMSTYTSKKQYLDVGVTFNEATIAGIVLGAIAIGLGVACLVAKRGKDLLDVQRLVPSILAAVAIVFAIITTSFASNAIHTLQMNQSSNKMSTAMSASAWLQLWAGRMELNKSLSIATYVEMILLIFVQIAVVVTAIVALIKLVDNFVSGNGKSALAANIILLILSVLYLVLAIIATTEPLETLNPTGQNGYELTFIPAIITFVFALLGLAASIAEKVVGKSSSRREAVNG